jgi:hypothetical protein
MSVIESNIRSTPPANRELILNRTAVVLAGTAGAVGGAIATVPSHELGHALVSTVYSLSTGSELAQNKQTYDGALVDFIVGGGRGLNEWVNLTAEQAKVLASRDHGWTALWELGGVIETSLIGILAVAAALPLIVDGIKSKNVTKVAMGAFIGSFGFAMEVATNGMVQASLGEGKDLFLAAQALRQMNFLVTPEELAYQATNIMLLGIFVLPIVKLILASRRGPR